MTANKTTPDLLELLKQRLQDSNIDGSRRITDILYKRDGRARKQCYNLFLAFAAGQTHPKDEYLLEVLQTNDTLEEYLTVATSLSVAKKTTLVSDLLLETKPNYDSLLNMKYFSYVQKIHARQPFDVSKFIALFLAMHRSKESINPKQHAGYKKVSFLCMYAFTEFNFDDEVNIYIKLLFDHILREKNWRWQKRSEVLYVSFFLWLCENHANK